MVNLLCCQAVVEPKLHPMVWTEEDLELELCDPDEVGDEITEDRKDDDTLYVDELDEEDRMFIFQWVIGGTDDIARFREEASTDLASVAEVAGA